MGKIIEPIGSAAFELIGARIFEIVADELFQQAAITYDDDFLDATVYHERFVPFGKTEMPAVNITYAGMVPLRETKNTAHREYRYFVDFYGASPTTDSERGDRRASLRVQRLMAVVDAILRDKRYMTLAFVPPFIMNTRTDAMDIGNQNDNKDAANVVLGRLEFIVAVPENVQDIEPRTLDSYVTQVCIDGTDNGYVFSGTNPNPLPSKQSTVFVNNNQIIELDCGENYNVRVLDTSTLNEVGAYDAYLDAWLIPSPGTPSLDIYINNELVYDDLDANKNIRVLDSDTFLPLGSYDLYTDAWLITAATQKTVTFNRPQVSSDVTYVDYDSVWRKINGHIPSRTMNQFQQELDPITPFKIKFDDSAITGITEHLFRFVSVTGGYLDHDAGTDTFTFYDKNGVLSTRSAVFTKDGDILMIDRLTGIAFAPNNQLESGGGKSSTDFYNDLWLTENIAGYTGEWFAPSIEELTVMMLFQTYAGVYYFLWRDSNFTNLSTQSLSSSPYMPNPAASIASMSVNGILIAPWTRLNTTSTGRFYLPCRTFDWNDYTG